MKTSAAEARILKVMDDGKPWTIYDLSIKLTYAECTVRRHIDRLMDKGKLFKVATDSNNKHWYSTVNQQVEAPTAGKLPAWDIPKPDPLMASLFGGRTIKTI